MKIETKEEEAFCLRFLIIKEEKIVARSRLYFLRNDLRPEPFAFIEDVWVNKDYRGKGLGTLLYQKMIKVAKEKRCYKIIGCSRFSREKVHSFIEHQGFKKHGFCFRFDFT